MMTLPRGIDNWSAFVALLAQQVLPSVTITDVCDRLGVGALFVMSEEWWDPSVIDMSPRIHVGYIPALCDIRQQQLMRMRALGLDMQLTWHRIDDPQLAPLIANAISIGRTVGVYGMTNSMAVRVHALNGSTLTGSDASGNEIALELPHLRAPAGVLCVVADRCPTASRDAIDELGWLVHLLNGVTTIAFDTPRHPLRDWQVWHIGVDAFAVAALSAETAAPLAIVSDNVARIIHAYMWRIDWLQQQLMRIRQSVDALAVREAIDACDDVRFFLNFVAQQYPVEVTRRALSLPEGALIAETCRDTRQVLRSIADGLGAIG